MLVPAFHNCQHAQQAACDVASLRQQNTQVSYKHNSRSANFQAQVDRLLYKQVSQMMIVKWFLR